MPGTEKACRDVVTHNFIRLAKEQFGVSEAALHGESRRVRYSSRRSSRRPRASAASSRLVDADSSKSSARLADADGDAGSSAAIGEASTSARSLARTQSSSARASRSSLLSDLPGIELQSSGDEVESDEEMEGLEEEEEDEEVEEETDNVAEVAAVARRELPKRLSKMVQSILIKYRVQYFVFVITSTYIYFRNILQTYNKYHKNRHG